MNIRWGKDVIFNGSSTFVKIRWVRISAPSNNLQSLCKGTEMTYGDSSVRIQSAVIHRVPVSRKRSVDEDVPPLESAIMDFYGTLEKRHRMGGVAR